MIDTSLLIEYYRKAKKDETRLYQHAAAGKKLVVSASSEYEILNGAKPCQIEEKESVLAETRNKELQRPFRVMLSRGHTYNLVTVKVVRKGQELHRS